MMRFTMFWIPQKKVQTLETNSKTMGRKSWPVLNFGRGGEVGLEASKMPLARPVQSWLLGPNQRSTQLSWYEFEPNQRSNQIFGSKFKLLPYQRFYQISWFNLKPNQRSSQIPGFTFVPNQSLNQIVCKIILGFNHRDEYSHIEKKLRLKL